jgi:CRP-like cAMP-binding protein
VIHSSRSRFPSLLPPRLSRETWPSPASLSFPLAESLGACMLNILETPRPATRTLNKLLATLPLEEFQRLQPNLILLPLNLRQVLHKDGQLIRDVYFPSDGACSLTKTMQDGRKAEIATIGSEGVIGAGVFFGDDFSPGDAFVQVAGCSAYKISKDHFMAEMGRREALYDRITRYTQALLAQVMQTTVCNGLHSAEQRCCRWLLMTRDRVGTNDMKLTHEFLAIMLGVRRPTVTLIMQSLQSAGLVDNTRGTINIVGLAGLQAASCECYESVKANFHRLLPEIPAVG